MLNFFLPVSKVQKDRRILRETDQRMAKYSRRGLILNFLAYLVCIAGGRFVDENPVLTTVLTIGLLLITVLRGFYLFRFDVLYPRAPAKWRNQYFAVTLVGAIWWGVILASITIALQLQDETHLIWLYTVVFFSTTASAFAPYHRFLNYYQFFGIMPAVGAAFYLTTFEGYLYGAVLAVFYFLLAKQCRLISENYWQRRESAYALSKKTLSIEEEKRDTKSSVQLNKEFLKFLNKDLKDTLSQLRVVDFTQESNIDPKIYLDLEELYSNIRDFDGVLSKDIYLENKIFNIRHEIQYIVSEYILKAEKRNVQIETALSPSLPMRLKGDAVRLAQIIKTLLNNILRDVENSIVLIEVEFLREYENAGELYVTVSRGVIAQKKSMFSEKKFLPLQENISLCVAKGFADLMNGSIELIGLDKEEQKIRFNAKLEVANREGQLDFHKNSFEGKNVLLVHSKPRIVDIKRQELDALGFNVFTETQYKRAFQTLINSYKFQNPIESLLFYVEPDSQAVEEFCVSLTSDESIRYTQKLVAATPEQERYYRELGYDEAKNFFYVSKPMGLFELESSFAYIFSKKEQESESQTLNANVLLFCQENTLDKRLEAAVKSLNGDIAMISDLTSLASTLKLDGHEIVLIDYDSQDNVGSIVDQVRAIECQQEAENYIPVIGVSIFNQEIGDNLYELGFDDFVDLSGRSKNMLEATVKYWETLV